MSRAGRAAALLTAGALAAACARGEPVPPTAGKPAPAPRRPVRVLAVHPHDPAAYTQGLVFQGGRLYESTGHEGRSRLREVEIATGRVLREVALADGEFGEGLALVGETLIQLTWRNGIAHRWRRADFAPEGDHSYAGEGWGLACDGRRLVQSDGSDRLTWRDPRTFAPLGTLRVTRDGAPLAYLNELEWARGLIFANVWMADEIVAIVPADGRVVVAYDASGLLDPEAAARAEVLNGIAYDPGRDVFYVTGKWWPQLFEIALDP